MVSEEVKSRRWQRVEYERVIGTGFFQSGDRVELGGGQLIVAEVSRREASVSPVAVSGTPLRVADLLP